MKNLFFVIGLTVTLGHTTVFANEGANSLVEICKADCPKAKSDEEAHKCVEKKGRLNKEFRKSKCWEVNEAYEKKTGAATEEKE